MQSYPRSRRIGTSIRLWAAIVLALCALIPTSYPVYAQEPVADPSSSEVTIVEQTMDAAGIHTVVRIDVRKDAFLSSSNPNTNFGSVNNIQLGWIAELFEAARMLIEFNISQIPPDATINSAELYINQTGTVPFNDAPMDIRAQYMRSDWNETFVTWNNANFLGGDVLPLVSVDNRTGWKAVPVTDLVRTWYSGVRPNFGLIITGNEVPIENRSRVFSSRESGGFAPYVLVDFTVSCDSVAPVASVQALPQFSPGSYQVTWSGQDFAPANCAPTGIAHFDVDYRVNGGSWQSWRRQTDSTSRTFDNLAQNGSFVEFRARATDNAGNVQSFGSPQASTRVDTEPPVATVNPLPEYTGSPFFTLTWGGTDNLSGIATYDVQWREDGGDWQSLLERTTQTSFAVTGAQPGVRYELRARATDNVGNGQAWSDTPQTFTTIVVNPVSEILPFNPSVLKPTAPITDSFTVSWSSFFAPGTSIANFEIFYQFNNRPWQLWRTFPGTASSGVFNFSILGLGDGVYSFEAVATNNLTARESQASLAEQSIIVDLDDTFNPSVWIPSIRNSQVAQ